MNMSFSRSVILRFPSRLNTPMSPVWSQPSASMAAALASGSPMYPAITL
jgi:hypothetical protein